MTKNYRDITSSVSKPLSLLRDDIPDVMKSFSALGQSATRDGVLDRKTKELIALCLGVAGHCDACIGFHMKTLVKLGATKSEVEEALAVCVYMGGGPSLMYAADALAAFEQLSVQEAVAA
jgi:AhpD family alkylhydroperoxidase